MADEIQGTVIDWETAYINAQQLVTQFRALHLLADVLLTANQARGWLAGAGQDVDRLKAEIAGLKVERDKAADATKAAKRLQQAAEENARLAAAEAKAAEDAAAARIRAAQDAQAGRLKDLEDALEGRRRILESDLAARKAELDEQIGVKQAALSEATAQVEALRNRLGG